MKRRKFLGMKSCTVMLPAQLLVNLPFSPSSQFSNGYAKDPECIAGISNLSIRYLYVQFFFNVYMILCCIDSQNWELP